MSDDELRRRYQAALSRHASTHPGVGVDEIERLVAGQLTEGEALRVLDLVMSDPALRVEYEMLRAVSTAGKPTARERSGRSWALGIGLAASLLLAAILWQAFDQRARPVSEIRGGDSAVDLLEPAEGRTVTAPVVLAWGRVEGARSYRVEVLDSAGEVVLTRMVADTALTLLAVEMPGAASYRWWVEARLPSGEVRSTIRRFTLQVPGRR